MIAFLENSLLHHEIQALSPKERGTLAETWAVRYLTQQGLRFIERNITIAGTELDLILEDDQGLIFVEVRARDNYFDIHPFETVTKPKQNRIIRGVQAYLAKYEGLYRDDVRLDVIAVSLKDGTIEWLQNAIETN